MCANNLIPCYFKQLFYLLIIGEIEDGQKLEGNFEISAIIVLFQI